VRPDSRSKKRNATASRKEKTTMNRKLTKREHAERYAIALEDTARRYLFGFMTRATFMRHRDTLWASIDAKKLRADVERALRLVSTREVTR
jgi:hypothetical protein